MASLNKVILVGNVGKDPEVRHLEGGSVVATFSLATSETFKDRLGNKVDQTEWHNIVLWGQKAEFTEKYIKKGTQIYVEGKIQTRNYEKDGIKRYYTEIYAENIQLLGKKPETGEVHAPQAAQPTDMPTPPPVAEDDLPF